MSGLPVYAGGGLNLYIQLDGQSHNQVYTAAGAAAEGLAACH
jgi:hypothetical protein